MSLRTHRLFERFIIPPAVPVAIDGELTIASIKFEVLEVTGIARTFFDVILLLQGRCISIPCIEFEAGADDPLIYPARLAVLGERILKEAGAAAVQWFRAQAPSDGHMQLFVRDDDLQGLIADGGIDGFAAVPGFSAYNALFATLDRYEHAATRASARRVLDLRAGSGLGAAMLAGRAAHVDAVSESRLHRRLASRFGRKVEQRPSAEHEYDLVVAFAIFPQTLAEWMKRLQPYIDRGCTVVLSVHGDHVEAFADVAASAVLLVGPAGDYDRRYNETLIWFEPRITRTQPAPLIAAQHTPAQVQSKLSILFVLRSNASEFPGGDSIQVYRTAEALSKRGHNAVVTLEEQPSAAGFDIVHLSNMTIPHETLRAAAAVERDAKAVVLMPIFIDHSDEGVWGYRAVLWAYGFARDEGQLAANLKAIAHRAVAIETFVPPPQRLEMEPGYLQAQKELLHKTDFMLANAFSEVHRIYRYVDCSVPFAIVPSCTDANLYGKAAKSHFVERYGLADFVLMTGRFEPRKNQLSVMHALRDSGRKLVFIGRNQFAPYGLLVRMYWPDNLTVFRFMPEEELAGAYAAARVLAIPSWDEVVSLSSLNGAVSETPMVLSRNGYEHEYFGDDAYYCDPGDAADIARAIDEAWAEDPARAQRLARLSERVREEYTWQRAAERTEEAYFRLLQDNPRGRRRLSRGA